MKVAGTILTRIILMCSAFAVVILNMRNLGAEGQGTAGLIAFGILLVQALSNFIGGGALVYLVPRMQRGESFWPSLTWSVISTILFFGVFNILPVVPSGFIVHACAIGLIQSLHISLQQVTLAQERISSYNGILAMQSALMAVLLFVLFEAFGWVSIYAFITSLYVSHGLTLLGFIAINRKWIAGGGFRQQRETWKSLFALGKFAQGGNVLHLLNQRLNLVFLENLWVNGRLATGVYSVALYAAEAIWTVSKSLSIVQYARISNEPDDLAGRSLTLQYLRISLLLVSASCAALVMIPSSWYTTIFTSDASDLKPTLLWLIPGILANGASIIYAHYFSGRGRHRENMIASALGLGLSVILAVWLVPTLGLAGAAISTSAALVIQASWFVSRFHRRPVQRS